MFNCISQFMKKKIIINNTSNYLIKCNVDELLNETKYLPIYVTNQWKNNLELELTSIYDMIFIISDIIYIVIIYINRSIILF